MEQIGNLYVKELEVVSARGMEQIVNLYVKELDEVASARGSKLRRVYITGLEQLRDAPAMREVLQAGAFEDGWYISNLSQLTEACQLDAYLHKLDDTLAALECCTYNNCMDLSVLSTLEKDMVMLQQPNRLAAEEQIDGIVRMCRITIQCAQEPENSLSNIRPLLRSIRNMVKVGRNRRVIIYHRRNQPQYLGSSEDLEKLVLQWDREPQEPSLQLAWYSRFVVEVSATCISEAAALRRLLRDDEIADRRWFVIGLDRLEQIGIIDELLVRLLSNTEAILHHKVPEFPSLDNLLLEANQLCDFVSKLDDVIVSVGTKTQVYQSKEWVQKLLEEARQTTIMSEEARSFATTAMAYIESLRSYKTPFIDKSGEWVPAPSRYKYEDDGESDVLRFGLSTMQGWTNTMDDTFAAIVNFDDGSSFFGVYDGHDGKGVSEFCSNYLHKVISGNEKNSSDDFSDCIRKGFLSMDEMMKGQRGWRKLNHLCLYDDPADSASSEKSDESSDSWETEEQGPHSDFIGPKFGCTACIVVIRNEQLYVANAGDCRCVASHKGHCYSLTSDHVPNVPSEKERILSAGGSVVDGRVNGILKFSRGIGFIEYKKNETLPAERQIVTAHPDIQLILHSKDDDFIVLASSGVWETVSSLEVVDFVRNHLKPGVELSSVCSKLLDHCCPRTGHTKTGRQNMTVLLVEFKKSYDSTLADEVLWPFNEA